MMFDDALQKFRLFVVISWKTNEVGRKIIFYVCIRDARVDYRDDDLHKTLKEVLKAMILKYGFGLLL